MPTMLNVNEAKANFSGVLAEVENKLTVMRDLGPLPGFAGKVKMHGEWFGDDSSEWENA